VTPVKPERFHTVDISTASPLHQRMGLLTTVHITTQCCTAFEHTKDKKFVCWRNFKQLNDVKWLIASLKAFWVLIFACRSCLAALYTGLSMLHALHIILITQARRCWTHVKRKSSLSFYVFYPVERKYNYTLSIDLVILLNHFTLATLHFTADRPVSFKLNETN